jgi:O-antigen ligase
VFGSIIFGLALAPFWFGGNRPLAWSLSAFWFPTATVLYEFGRSIGRRRHPIALHRIALAVVCISLVGLWAGLQMAPWFPSAYQHPAWAMTGEALGRDVPGSISINVDDTMVTVVKLVTAACLFWTTLQLCRSARRARFLVAALAAIGAMYALYGTIAFFVFPDTILWYPKLAYNQVVTSTFLDRNTYATYAGIGLICAIAMSVEQFAKGTGRPGGSVKRSIAVLIATGAGSGGVWLAATLIIGLALTLTAARGGILSSLGGLLALCLLISVRGRKFGVGLGLGLLLALALVSAVGLAYGDAFAQRLANQGLESEDRLDVYRLVILSIADNPIFGAGWGTFRDIFPMYRDTSLNPFDVWDHARNSYLEAVQGLGLPAASLLGIALLSLTGRAAYGALGRKRFAIAPVVATASGFIVLLEAFVDYGIQIPAVTLTWCALLAAGVAQSWSDRIPTDR